MHARMLHIILVQVANEAAVLSAVRQYAQLQKPGVLRDLAINKVTPSGALPEEMLGHMHRLAKHRNAFLVCLIVPVVLFR